MSVLNPLHPNQAVAARKNGRFSIFFHIFVKLEQSKKVLPHIGVQYIKLKPMKVQVKCKRNRFISISRYALVRILIWVFALNFGGILREFGEILGKYRMLDGRPLGSIGLRAEAIDIFSNGGTALFSFTI